MSEKGITPDDLICGQKMTLNEKIKITEEHIKAYYEKVDGKIYIGFSGGKDSTVMLDIVRKIYPDAIGVFVNTGLEYPEIKNFVKTKKNIIVIKPKMRFDEVLKKYGYPIVSKQVARAVQTLKNPTDKNKITRNLFLTGYTSSGKLAKSYKLSNKWRYLIDAPFKISGRCCDKLKKEPFKKFEKETGLNRMIGIMASDSHYRRLSALNTGINYYGNVNICSPLLMWTEQDILLYIKKYNLDYCSIYGNIKEKDNNLYCDHISRTGCIFCMFGVHLEKEPNRFQRLKNTHPAQYKYCIETLGCGEVLDYINVPYK